MDICIKKPALGGSLEIISSKSYAHRAIICAMLSEGETRVKFNSLSKDIAASLECAGAMGAIVKNIDGGAEVGKISRKNSPVLNCNESGSTLRFLIPVAAALNLDAVFEGSERLMERPLTVIEQALREHGCTFEFLDKTHLRVNGQLTSGEYTLRGDISSQYVSGLLFALPLLNGDSKITLIEPVESRAYIEMSVQVIRQFGIEIEQTHNCFYIKGSQTYKNMTEYTVPGDWSNAAFWLALGALGGEVTLRGLDINSLQGDRKILDILKCFGAIINADETSVSVKTGTLKALNVDAAQIPDLVPIIAGVASVAQGTSRIYGAARLRLKESDRIETTVQMLCSLGADVHENGDELIVNGKTSLLGGEANSFNDHRIAMTAAVMACRCSGEVVIRDFGAVAKSYPDFLEKYILLGGQADVLQLRK